jgi:hypothetical protein
MWLGVAEHTMQAVSIDNGEEPSCGIRLVARAARAFAAVAATEVRGKE